MLCALNALSTTFLSHGNRIAHFYLHLLGWRVKLILWWAHGKQSIQYMLNERIGIQITQPFTNIVWVVPCIRATCNSQGVWHPASSPLAKPGCSEAGKALGASSLIEKVTGVRGRPWYARDSLHKPTAPTFIVSCQSVKTSGFGFQMQPWASARLSTRGEKKLKPLMTFAFIFVLFNPFFFFLRMFYDICNLHSCTYLSLYTHTTYMEKMLSFFFFNLWDMWWK